MKGYKATKNFKCRNQTYKVGKTYTADKLEMCKHGFHFCENMEDVLWYYNFDENFILLEVEALGNIETEGNKSVTDKLKILRVVPYKEYTFKDELPELEFDERGNIISMTYPDGDKYTCEYDEKDNRISVTYPYGDNYTYEYDERGNMISMSYPDGDKIIYEYDEKGNNISMTCPDGYKCRYSIPKQTIVTEED